MSWRGFRRATWLLVLFSGLVVAFFSLQKWLLGGSFALLFAEASSDYMLSAIAQAAAAIIGIVVTVTLVAAQLSASAYVPRVIALFRKHVDLWVLVLVYGVAITFSLSLLNITPASSGLRESLVILAFSAFPAAFLMLIPYTNRTLRILDPRSMILQLLEQVPRPSKVATQDPSKREAGLERALAPIEDMLLASIRRADFSTAMVGLTELTEAISRAVHPRPRRTRRLDLHQNKRTESYYPYVRGLVRHLTRPARALLEADTSLGAELIRHLLQAARSVCRSSIWGELDVLRAVTSIGERAVALDDRDNALTAMRGVAATVGWLPFLKSRVLDERGTITYVGYLGAIECVITQVERIADPGVKRWGLTFALDACECLACIGRAFAGKRPRRDNDWIGSPHSEPIMRVLVSLDHTMVDSFLEGTTTLSSYAGEPLLFVRVIQPVATIARLSYEKGYCAQGGLSDFGRAVCAISNIGAAASLTCSDRFLGDISKTLADLAEIDRTVVLKQIDTTMSRHYLLSTLDLSRFKAQVVDPLAKDIVPGS